MSTCSADKHVGNQLDVLKVSCWLQSAPVRMMERSIFSAKYIFVENLFRRYCFLWFNQTKRLQNNSILQTIPISISNFRFKLSCWSDGFCCITVQALGLYVTLLGAGIFFCKDETVHTMKQHSGGGRYTFFSWFTNFISHITLFKAQQRLQIK